MILFDTAELATILARLNAELEDIEEAINLNFTFTHKQRKASPCKLGTRML
jgi:hypothetical protein